MLGDARVSGFVCTYNEQANIRSCLESIRWADELLVVDSFSEDGTVEIADAIADRVIQREFKGYVDQFEFARSQTTGDWAVWLDADERLAPDALEELTTVFERPGGPGCDGFALRRKTYFMDRWIKHCGWYPQYKVRFFRNSVTRIRGIPPHAEAMVDGQVDRLKAEILHYSYPGGVVEMLQKSAQFAGQTARARFERGRRFSLLRTLFEPPLVFAHRYLLRLGFLDGLPGLAICASAAYYRFVRQVKLWELVHKSEPWKRNDEADAEA